MNNKLLIEEINRVREVMGISPNRSMQIVSEAGTAPLVRFIKMLAKRRGIKGLIIPGGPIEKLFTDNMDFFWKVKNKFPDELVNVEKIDDLLEHVLANPKSAGTKQILREAFMSNPQTRELISKSADNLLGSPGLGKIDNIVTLERFLRNLDEAGIPLTNDDLIKVADDIFKKIENPIRITIKNAGTISKHLFGKPRKKWMFGKTQSSTGIEKGKVIVEVMKDQGVKTSEDAQQFMLRAGMNEADAAKIKVAIEAGQTVDNKLANEIFEKLAKTGDNELNLAFIDSIRNNKFLVNKIQRAGDTMTPKEVRTLLGLSDEAVPEHIIQDIIDTIGPKKVYNPFKRGTLPYKLNPEAGWYGTYIRRKMLGWASGNKYESLYHLYNFILTISLVGHIVPFGMIFGKADSDSWFLWRWIFGTEGGGTFDCENNIECVLKPTEDNMAKATKDQYEKLYLEEDLTVYYDAAQYIGKELGTYTESGGWYTSATLEDFDPPNWGVDETDIADKLNERPSLFGIMRVATEYYQKTSRHIWDDAELMKWSEDSYVSFLADKFKKFNFIPYVDVDDVGREILRTLMSKPQRTIKDSGEIPRDRDFRDDYNALFKFPKYLFVTDNEGYITERWKPCYKGVMPLEFVQAVSSELVTEGDFQKLEPEQFNQYYSNYAPEKYKTKLNAYMKPTKTENNVTVYSIKGTTDCGDPEELQGLQYEELKKKAEDTMDNFIDGLDSGNGGKPPMENMIDKTNTEGN